MMRSPRRASLNDRVKNEVGGLLGRLGISGGRKTLDPRCRERNYAWTAAEIHRASMSAWMAMQQIDRILPFARIQEQSNPEAKSVPPEFIAATDDLYAVAKIL
jgi:hypothetical protein